MGLFDSIFGKKREPNIVTKDVSDHAKLEVSSPLSEYLKKQIGKSVGAPEDLPEISPEGVKRFDEFVSLDSGEFFKTKVADPATKRFREDFLPEIREGFAGSLRGSGRFRTEEEAVNRFSEGLAQTEAQLSLQLPVAQIAATGEMFKLRDQQIQRKIENFMRNLPELSPATEQALRFLSSGTETGKVVLSGLDPGKATSGFGDFLNILGQIGATAAGAAIGGI